MGLATTTTTTLGMQGAERRQTRHIHAVPPHLSCFMRFEPRSHQIYFWGSCCIASHHIASHRTSTTAAPLPRCMVAGQCTEAGCVFNSTWVLGTGRNRRSQERARDGERVAPQVYLSCTKLQLPSAWGWISFVINGSFYFSLN
jgi:hypothetical protein